MACAIGWLAVLTGVFAILWADGGGFPFFRKQTPALPPEAIANSPPKIFPEWLSIPRTAVRLDPARPGSRVGGLVLAEDADTCRRSYPFPQMFLNRPGANAA